MSRFYQCVIVVVTMGLLSQPVNAWWDNGHMLVAEIAKQTLTSQDPTIVQRIDTLLATWKADFPDRTEFTPAATLPDFLKCTSYASYCQGMPNSVNGMDAWHFTDRPYNPQNLTLPVGADIMWYKQPSAIEALGEFVSTFRTAKANWGWVFSLSFLIHIHGDLHQPLHAVTGFFNSTAMGLLPEGDRGGNSIRITSDWPAVTNLHAFWDSAGGLYQHNAPLNAFNKTELSKNATELIKQYSVKSLGYNASSFQNCWDNPPSYANNHTDLCIEVFKLWANQSYDLAIDAAYPTIHQRMYIASNSTYTKNAREISQKQITLAGYRLAGIIKAVIDNIPDQTTGAPNVKPYNSSTTLKQDVEILEASTGILLFSTIVFMTLYCRARKSKPASIYEQV